MARRSKNTEVPPRLIRELLRLEKYKSQGESTKIFEENIQKLSDNPAELALALQWFTAMDHVHQLDRYESQQALAFAKEVKRTDLTIPEGLRLAKALKEKEDRFVIIARKQLEFERQQKFRGCG